MKGSIICNPINTGIQTLNLLRQTFKSDLWLLSDKNEMTSPYFLHHSLILGK